MALDMASLQSHAAGQSREEAASIRTRVPQQVAPSTGPDIARRWLAPGLIAGAAFLAFGMLVGTTPWALPEGIAHTIGIGSPDYDFQPQSLLVGVIVHLGFSVGLGALLIALARRFHLRGKRLVAAAVLFMWVESGISVNLVLRPLFPATLPLLLDAIPLWASFVGRNLYGLILGLVCARMWASRRGEAR